MTIRFRAASIVGAMALCWCSTQLALAQPLGDLCADAQLITCNSTTVVDNTLAGTELDDPGFSCHFDGVGVQTVGSVWFKFVATDTTIRASTCNSTGSADDTILGIFSGTCGAMTELNCSEDFCDLNSMASVGGLTIGETYYIQVGSYRNADRGPITLDLECPAPAGDPCELAEPLTLPTGIISFDTSVDTASATGGVGFCNEFDAVQVHNDHWFTFTTGEDACTVLLEVNDVDFYDLLVVVYSGSDCSNLFEENCTDEPDNPAVVSFPASANTTYWIRVGQWGTFSFGGETTLSLSCPTSLPTGACCSSLDGTCSEVTQPDCVAAQGTYQGDDTTCLSGPCISACCLPDFTCANVNGTVTGLPQSDCENPVESGGLGGTWLGPDTSCESSACPPANDDCDNSTLLTIPASINFNNVAALPSATGGGGSCNTTGAVEMQNDVWFTFTTGENACDLQIELSTPDFYDMIATLYTGTDCNDLTEIACGDEPQAPMVITVPSIPNTQFWLRVGDWGSFEGGGETLLTISCTQPCGTCPGDVNGDAQINGADVQAFTDCYLGGGDSGCGCADVDRDGDVDDDDVTAFTDRLLNLTGACATECNANDAGQLPSDEDALNSSGDPFEAADNFVALENDDITQVRWWGGYLPAGTCPDSADAFSITYFNDNNGRPGAIMAGPFAVDVVRFETGRTLAGLAPEFVFQANHPAVTVSAGECVWMSITNPQAGDCAWFWSISETGDGVAAQTDTSGSWPATSRIENDLAWCIDISTDAAGCPAPTGACCTPGPTCTVTTEADCTGSWQYDTPCTGTTCLPDVCEDAVTVTCGASVTFDNTFASPDAFTAPDPADPVPSCSFEGNPAQATVWFTFIGDGQTWTIQSCNTPNELASIGDTTLSVWSGACGALSEEACSEDFCFGGDVEDQGGFPEQWMSSVTVPTVLGQQYWIMWSNAFADRGNIQMDISCAP